MHDPRWVAAKWSVLTVACALLLHLAAATTGQASEPLPLDSLVFVTDDRASFGKGCDAISVFNSTTGATITRGEYRQSPGQLAARSDGEFAVAVSINGSPLLHMLEYSPDSTTFWESDNLEVRQLLIGGAPAISPNDEVLLLPTTRGVERYDMSAVGMGGIGPVEALYPNVMAAAMHISRDSRIAYVADADGAVHAVEIASMTRAGAVIGVRQVTAPGISRVRRTFASLSPDGRFLVINEGAGGGLSVVDLGAGTATSVESAGLRETWGVSFNHADNRKGLLAVHGNRSVAVYQFLGPRDPKLLVSAQVPPWRYSSSIPEDELRMRYASLAWTGSGDAIIAAVGSLREFWILEYSDVAGPSLRKRTEIDSCESADADMMGTDVLTLNDRLAPPPTPTVTPCPTPLPTNTSMVTLTPSPTVTPSSTPTVTITPTTTPTATRVLQPIYLPLLLKEECGPTQLQADVALVIDASTSMLEETRERRTKLAAAVEAVELFVGELNLPLDQAAVVQFNGDVELLQELTGDGSVLEEALGRLQVKRQTRIDLGIQVAREELRSARRRPGNQAVMIVLTDGRANPVGPDVAVREAQAAQSEGVTIFTIGLGEDLNLAALEAMASKPSYFYRAPDAEDLADIYSKIAVEIPCPATDFWGLR